MASITPNAAYLFNGVNVIPSTGEFTYDTVAHSGRTQYQTTDTALNTLSGPPSGFTTDFQFAIHQIMQTHPECQTLSIVISWFFNSSIANQCNVYPASIFKGGDIDGYSTTSAWTVSNCTINTSGLNNITSTNGIFVYAGTPSDQSVYNAIKYMQGLNNSITGNRMRIVFYPFLLGDVPSKKNDPNGTNPWRGRITYDPTGNLPDVSTGAEAAVSAFLGTATSSMFSGSNGTSTVTYSGSTTDWTYRRMILHYAKLCAQAGGVDLFLIGSELRGLETIRGRNWTRAGSSGTWDYPFLYGVQGSTNYGMVELAGEVQTILATASGYSKSTNIAATSPQMLVTYSPDWSSWMGWQHSSSNPVDYGQWPHLDQLYASSNIDLVSFDNYLPISDWTTAANGGLDGKLWAQPLPSSWPPSTGNVGLGLTGNPSIYSIPYLQANIEGGEKFNWYYSYGYNNTGFDPNGTCQKVAAPSGDRASQTRETYSSGQQILANKQLRWWWNNNHYALYPTTNVAGQPWLQQQQSTWTPHSKSIIMAEYGFPSCDKATNQPNLFFAGNTSESGIPYWSAWTSVAGPGLFPLPDNQIFLNALKAVYTYWLEPSQIGTTINPTVSSVPMIQSTFCSVWCADARPFPTFPSLFNNWGDSPNWKTGNWVIGKLGSTYP